MIKPNDDEFQQKEIGSFTKKLISLMKLVIRRSSSNLENRREDGKIDSNYKNFKF